MNNYHTTQVENPSGSEIAIKKLMGNKKYEYETGVIVQLKVHFLRGKMVARSKKGANDWQTRKVRSFTM